MSAVSRLRRVISDNCALRAQVMSGIYPRESNAAIVISTKGIARTEKSQKYTMLRFLDCVHLRFTPLEMTEESFSYELLLGVISDERGLPRVISCLAATLRLTPPSTLENASSNFASQHAHNGFREASKTRSASIYDGERN